MPVTVFAQWGDWVAPQWTDTLKNPFPGNQDAINEAKQLFTTICFVCHGNKGKGDGINALSLIRPPADLTSKRVQKQSDGTLFWKISEGNAPMLSFKSSLSEEQRWKLVNFIRELPKLYPPGSAQEAKQSLVLSSRMNEETIIKSRSDELVAANLPTGQAGKTNSTLSKKQASQSNYPRPDRFQKPHRSGASKKHFSIMSGIGFLAIFGFTIIILALYAMVKAVKVIADYKTNLQ